MYRANVMQFCSEYHVNVMQLRPEGMGDFYDKSIMIAIKIWSKIIMSNKNVRVFDQVFNG